jgi:hypothetical protein
MSTNYAPLNPGLPMSGQGLDSQAPAPAAPAAPLYNVTAPSAPAPGNTPAQTFPLPSGAPPPPMAAPTPGGPGASHLYGSFAGVAGGGQSTAPTLAGTSQSGSFLPHEVHPLAGKNDIVNFLLPVVKGVESGGSSNPYQIQHPDGHPEDSSSGAYQVINSTWGGYGGYARAADAPPEVQDQWARGSLGASYDKHNGDPFQMLADHFLPARSSDPSTWNDPVKGNKDTTVAQYVAAGINKAGQLAGTQGTKDGNDRVQSYIAAWKQKQAQAQAQQQGQLQPQPVNE